jgi:hypothetical protein
MIRAAYRLTIQSPAMGGSPIVSLAAGEAPERGVMVAFPAVA